MKTVQIVVILIVSLVALAWLRAGGKYDFDIRTVIPFMRGPNATLHDFAGIILIAIGIGGVRRLRRGRRRAGTRNRLSDRFDAFDDSVDNDAR